MTFSGAGAGPVRFNSLNLNSKKKTKYYFLLQEMGAFGNLGNMMSMFNNPQFMNMATQLMSDPQMQNV